MPPPNNPKSNPTPTNHLTFDLWNTSAIGHQVSDSTPGTAWRRTREAKLAQQFRSGDCSINSLVYDSGKRVYERGEWEWDWGGDARGGRGGDGKSKSGGRGVAGAAGIGGDSKQRDIRFMMRAGKGGGGDDEPSLGKNKAKGESVAPSQVSTLDNKTSTSSIAEPISYLDQTPGAVGSPLSTTTSTCTNTSTISKPAPSPPTPIESTILRDTTIYINGQTTPLISDHKLKQLLVAHGAKLALGFSRRVTHVIIGKPNAGPGKGAGGGLAAGKIQKEIKRGGWRGMRIVGVEWVLESIKAGERLPETRFVVNLTGQRSVLGFM
ncbi:hypothetical protein BJX70DRAFT_396445 [Aspergillus crustosus]